MLKVLNDEQVKALVAAPDLRTRLGRKERALLSILAYGGLRISEACHLKREEIHFVGDIMRLTFEGKGGKTRTVSLPHRAVSDVQKWLVTHNSPYVFPSRYGPPMTPSGGFRIVKKNAAKAGLPSWVRPHTLRHSYGTKLMRETGDLFLVSRILGHSNMQTTARYYLAFDPSYADRAVKIWE